MFPSDFSNRAVWRKTHLGGEKGGMLTTQDNVYLSITTVLGKDKIFLREFRGVERMSGLFEFFLELYIPYQVNPHGRDLDFSSLLETSATVTLCLNGKKRYFNGIISALTQGSTFISSHNDANRTQEITLFYATLRPTAWLMTLTQQCCIFQKQTAIDIIKTVLSNHQITLQDKTSTCGTLQKEFCVQYNESDFNFISRLMEEEGIAYYFKHEEGSHTLVLVDESSPFAPLPDSDLQTISLSPYLEKPTIGAFSFYNLRISEQIVSSKHTYTDYDFEKPSTSLTVHSPGKGTLKEMYHYPGRYTLVNRGTSLSDIRMAALEFPQGSFTASSDVPILEVGYTFTLSNELAQNLVRQDVNGKSFTIFSIEHHASLIDFKPDLAGGYERPLDLGYENKVIFYKKEVPYRPPQTARIPRIYGTQTATVCGKEGEEIWTDKYGRIMVKFHWDLSSTNNDSVSCWIRVAQNWAHQNWGAYFIPRVGQEVVITFLDGDPDQPLVTGCVYNGTNLPPYTPDMATKSGFKTNSSKGGGGFNELYFEDKKGAEVFYMQAQTDMTTLILDGQRTTTIQGTKGKGHDILNIMQGKRDTTLSKGDDFLTLSAGSRTTKISDNLDLEIGKNATIKVGKDCNIDIGGNCTLTVTGDITIKAKDVMGTIQQQVVLKGDQITINGQTTLTLESAAISAMGQSAASIKAGGALSLTGGTASIIGGMTTIIGNPIKLV